MKILLIKPSQENVYGMKMSPAYPSLGIMYIASVLELDKHEVKILDLDADVDKSLEDEFLEFAPQLVGITSVTPTINEAFSVAKRVKKLKNIPVVIGGVHVTIAPETVITREEVDFVVIGEGERTIRELAYNLENGLRDFSKIKGICFKENGTPVTTAPRELEEDLDKIPFPAWHLLKNLKKFLPPDASRFPVASIMTTRGCPADCTFCCTKQIYGHRYRTRSIQNVMKEIDFLIAAYHVKEIHFLDDTFNLSKKRVLDFCRIVKEKNIKIDFEFSNGLRADYIDEDVLRALKSIRVKNVGFGVESGNEEILKNIKKGIDLKTYEEAFNLAKKIGLETWGFFIFGLPGDTVSTMRQTIAFAKKLDPDFAKFLILKPYPGSEVFTYFSQKGLIDDLNFDHYGAYTPPVHHLEGLTSEDILYWQRRAYREFYFRPKKILSHLLRLRSAARLRTVINGLNFIFKSFLTIK